MATGCGLTAVSTRWIRGRVSLRLVDDGGGSLALTLGNGCHVKRIPSSSRLASDSDILILLGDGDDVVHVVLDLLPYFD